jgi:hypothetical protein
MQLIHVFLFIIIHNTFYNREKLYAPKYTYMTAHFSVWAQASYIPKTLNNLALQSLDFEGTWWR